MNATTQRRTTSDIGEFMDRVPPQDLEAERCVLGSLLLANESYDEVQPLLSHACFYTDAHRRIFKAVAEMIGGKRPVAVDAVTLRDELTRRGELDDVGGVQYLLQLCETVPHAAHAEYYAGIVREKWLQRSIIESCSLSIKEAYHGGVAAEIMEKAEVRLSRLNDYEAVDVVSMADSVDTTINQMFAVIDDPSSLPGIEIPFADMADSLVKFVPSSLYILAARPSHGKTALAMSIAKSAAVGFSKVLVFSLEMTHLELTRRLLSEATGIAAKTILRGEVDASQTKEVFAASQVIRDYQIRIADSDATVASIKQIARREKRTHGVDFIIVDYLQHISATDGNANREQQVSEMSRSLKKLAKQLNVPVLCLAQLNRGVEGREDKTPKLADLRDSGSIEQDADAVLMLHVPAKYDNSLPRGRNCEAHIFIAKNRHGPTGNIVLNYDETCGRYWGQESSRPGDNGQQMIPYNGF